MSTADAAAGERRSKGAAGWARRLGVVGFLFFFVKGMLWLLVPAVLVWGEGCFGPG